jgi:hypothetical protein
MTVAPAGTDDIARSPTAGAAVVTVVTTTPSRSTAVVGSGVTGFWITFTGGGTAAAAPWMQNRIIPRKKRNVTCFLMDIPVFY